VVKRLGILGTFVWDRIWTLDDQAAGRPFETWGGMAYSLAAGAAALSEEWEIVPIAKVGWDLAEEAHAFLDTLPSVADDRPGVVLVDEPNNRVELTYTDASRRGERLTGGVPGWTWEELKPVVAGLDALYVNFFSGFELGLEVAERLRAGYAGPLYADLHSLFLGCPGAGVRQMRALPRWERWLGCFDVVQLNEDELAMLGATREPVRREPPFELLRYGPQAAFVTLGADGAAWASRRPQDMLAPRSGRARVLREGGWTPAPPRVEGGDPTGCGDVWGIAAFAGLLGGAPAVLAAVRANALAAAKMEHRGALHLYEHLDGVRPAWAPPPPVR
jgi:sugar/nucleoside kinase (ribokinase family)